MMISGCSYLKGQGQPHWTVGGEEELLHHFIIIINISSLLKDTGIQMGLLEGMRMRRA